MKKIIRPLDAVFIGGIIVLLIMVLMPDDTTQEYVVQPHDHGRVSVSYYIEVEEDWNGDGNYETVERRFTEQRHLRYGDRYTIEDGKPIEFCGSLEDTDDECVEVDSITFIDGTPYGSRRTFDSDEDEE